MINIAEVKCFLKYIIFKESPFSYLKEMFLKFLNKYLKRGNYEYYPDEFKKILDNDNLIMEKKEHKEVLIKNINSIKSIFLASEHCLLSPKINWDKMFYDYEDYEALHRFRWIRYEMSTKDRLSDKSIIFSNDMLASWHNYHLVHNSIDNSDLAWCSHTITERISNIILFRRAHKSKDNDFIDELLATHIKLLLTKLEIFKSGHGNHLINNARSLLIYSIIYKNTKLEKFAFRLLRYSLDDFIYNDYSIDYSSHYQLLLLFWLNDIYRISEIYNKDIYCNYLSKFITSLKKSTLNFYIPNTQKFIFVGDISPDYPPSYLLQLIDINYKPKYSQEKFYDNL
tara:strand:+ start:1313 stop:2332 length:1020 start_codon:yes stop_codon:yes gene_type:complete